VDKLDEYIEAVMLERLIPGLSLAVVHDGKVVKSKAYGLANTELNVPATTGSVYQIQSITKSFMLAASCCWPKTARSDSTTRSPSI
jgi:CubicO group peptidase (beta-lactamase class C family)